MTNQKRCVVLLMILLAEIPCPELDPANASILHMAQHPGPYVEQSIAVCSFHLCCVCKGPSSEPGGCLCPNLYFLVWDLSKREGERERESGQFLTLQIWGHAHGRACEVGSKRCAKGTWRFSGKHRFRTRRLCHIGFGKCCAENTQIVYTSIEDVFVSYQGHTHRHIWYDGTHKLFQEQSEWNSLCWSVQALFLAASDSNQAPFVLCTYTESNLSQFWKVVLDILPINFLDFRLLKLRVERMKLSCRLLSLVLSVELVV